ncbi:response regulator transcription factor [Haloferula sp. BvORR071]|uniref:response regulator transcription factor n=1 Tax=Haloferula sp. BvORR071 TaxID=1396141 RepID=UPI000558A92E|nr:response regulator transcription factor [Haloferula sp. BvORR071]
MRCLLIEDYLPLRDNMRECLVEEGFVVDDCGAGDEGLWSAENHSYEVIILDIMLPVIDGLSILRRLRKLHDKTPVIMISARDSVENRVEGLNAGADDYLVKPFALAELVARVRALNRRRYDRESHIICIADLQIDTLRKVVTRGEREIVLTRLEYRMLEYLAHREDQTVSRMEIGEHVYQDHDSGNSNRVDVYISYLRRKLNSEGESDLIRTVRGLGYVISGRSP